MSQKLTLELLEAAERNLMRNMSEDAGRVIEVSAEELVSIKMDARFHVTGVTLRGVNLGTNELAALEHAILSCVNTAFQKVSLQIGDELAETFHDFGGHS
jgi:DNA-binding protein YbaB